MFADTTFPPAAPGIRFRDRVASFLAAVRAQDQARRDEVRLSHMSDRMLSDIGLTRDDVRQMRRSPYHYL